MTIDERLDRLSAVVDSLAAAVVAHDDKIEAHDRQIEALITVAEKLAVGGERQDARIRDIAESIASLNKRWEAYLNTLPRQ